MRGSEREDSLQRALRSEKKNSPFRRNSRAALKKRHCEVGFSFLCVPPLIARVATAKHLT